MRTALVPKRANESCGASGMLAVGFRIRLCRLINCKETSLFKSRECSGKLDTIMILTGFKLFL